MGRQVLVATVFLATLALGYLGQPAQASDPELTRDFVVPAGVDPATLDGSFFTFTGLRNPAPTSNRFATVTNANLATNFTALEGLGVSSALLQYPPHTVNRPHTHPRGTEILYIIEGKLDVGLVDTTNKLFTQTLQQGDLFVFPKGLVHFQINMDSHKTVRALAAFSSSNAGLVSLPTTLFGSEGPINDEVLAKSFGVSVDVIRALKAGQ